MNIREHLKQHYPGRVLLNTNEVAALVAKKPDTLRKAFRQDKSDIPRRLIDGYYKIPVAEFIAWWEDKFGDGASDNGEQGEAVAA